MNWYKTSQSIDSSDDFYFRAIKNKDMVSVQQMVYKAAKVAGFNIKAYHGSPQYGFTKFKDTPTYFSLDKEEAEVFQSSSASSIRVTQVPKGNISGIYSVFLKLGNTFDTRKKEHRDLFLQEFFNQGGEEWVSNSTPLTSRDLPDWTDGRDLVDWIMETKKSFDSIILDEGSLPQMDGGVRWRGFSIVVWNSSQIKSADLITYDDSGEIVPLSRRFDSGNDIRGAV